MKLVNGIDIDVLNTANINHDEIRSAILHNSPIEEKLHVVMVLSNPKQYARRYILAREFIQRMEQDPHVLLYIVELAYGNQEFHITSSENPRHLQIRGFIPLWHKENMITIGIKKLLPDSWKAVAWVDADVEFENSSWALDTLKVLNGCKDIVQVFSHCVDMGLYKNAVSITSSFGFQYFKKRAQFMKDNNNFWNTGYGWACTRTAYEGFGGLYENAIVGGGDVILPYSVIKELESHISPDLPEGYRKSLLAYQEKIPPLTLGYVPGVLLHHFHGLRENRKYSERVDILKKANYSPDTHVTHYSDGILVPTIMCPLSLLQDIMTYFAERNEDDMFIGS